MIVGKCSPRIVEEENWNEKVEKAEESKSEEWICYFVAQTPF
jgi:hypothetical protein